MPCVSYIKPPNIKEAKLTGNLDIYSLVNEQGE